MPTFRRRVLLTCVLLVSIVVYVPYHNPKWITRTAQFWHFLNPRLQDGSQLLWGTAPSLPLNTIVLAGLSCPKYSPTENSSIYFIGIRNNGAYDILNRTMALPASRDPQAVAVYGNELLVANHLGTEDSIAIYDLGAAFSGQLHEIGRIPNIPRPTNLLVHKNRLYVAAIGGHAMLGQGLYVYEKNASNQWVQVQRFLYADLFGRSLLWNGFTSWPDLAPIAMTIVDDVAYVSSMQSSSITLIDLKKTPATAYLGKVSGPNSRLFYPGGIAAHEGMLYVADHLFDFGIQVPVPRHGGDVTPDRILQFRQSSTHPFRHPYNILATRDRLFVTSERGNLYMFTWLKEGVSSAELIVVPDGAAIISLAEVPDAGS